MKRLLRYFRARQFERDLAAELQAHLDEKTDELTDEGMRPDEARALALRQFGNRTRLLERCREKWAFMSLDEIGQDVRYAATHASKEPGIHGGGGAVAGAGDRRQYRHLQHREQRPLRSLPYPQSDRLFAVWSARHSHGAEPMHVSAADFYDWRTQSHAFESLSAYASWPMNLTNIEEPRRLDTQLVTANLFSTLGVQAQIGRTFAPDEDQEQSAFVVVISHHLWRALGESPQIVGRQLTLNGSQATVIGVMPAGFAFPSRETDAWVPLSMSAKDRSNREGRWLRADWPASAERHSARRDGRDGCYLRTAGRGVPGDQYRMERVAGAAAGGTGGEDPPDSPDASGRRPPASSDHLRQSRKPAARERRVPQLVRWACERLSARAALGFFGN